MKYQLVGIRNLAHADSIFEQIKHLPNSEDIHIHSDEFQIELDNVSCYTNLQRLLSYEKVGLKEIDDHHHHHHEEEHTHDHGHSHDHSHAIDFSDEKNSARKMAIVFGVNIFFSLLEVVFGVLFNSASILADAVHDFGDALSIGLAWIFQKMSLKGSDSTFSYGYKRYSLLGALITSLVLMTGSVLMVVHSIEKLMNPVVVNYQGMLWLALFAIVANGLSAWMISKGSSHNESILSLHLLEDVLGWVGVLIVSVVLHFTDWYFLDPLLSLGIAVFILSKAFPQFMKIVRVFLQAVPDGIDNTSLKEEVEQVEDLEGVSHFHLWSLDGQSHMMSLTVKTSSDDIHVHEKIKNDIRTILAKHDISHSNIEIVYDPFNVIKSNQSNE